MKPSEILDQAANTLLRDGWYQGEYYKDDGTSAANRSGPCCQEGAISRAAFGYAYVDYLNSVRDQSEALRKAQDDASRYMRNFVCQDGHRSSIDFNDAPGRTREEVVNALRGAAAYARLAGE